MPARSASGYSLTRLESLSLVLGANYKYLSCKCGSCLELISPQSDKEHNFSVALYQWGNETQVFSLIKI